MSDLSVALAGNAPKHTLVANGKTYSFSLIDQDMKVAYERAIFQRARDAIAIFKKDMTSAEYMELLREIAAAYENGDFALEGTRGQKALGSPNGMLTLVSLLMGTDQQETMQLMISHNQEIISLFQKVMVESFPGIKLTESEHPKAESPPIQAQLP